MRHLGTSFRVVPVQKSGLSNVDPLSVFDMFRIGIGPSSSHTVGPMRAARTMRDRILNGIDVVSSIKVDLYGSLGATGRGHATDRAVMLGLAGFEPQLVPQSVVTMIEHSVTVSGKLCLDYADHYPKGCSETCRSAEFVQEQDIAFEPRTVLPGHPNALKIVALSKAGQSVEGVFYSVGGGFVVEERANGANEEAPQRTELSEAPSRAELPYQFSSAARMLELADEHSLTIAQMMRANELVTRSSEEISSGLAEVWNAMDECIASGLAGHGLLPGGLRVPRRAPALHRKLRLESSASDPLRAMDWINLYALAVNEENAAGHRVVTAPTNGAAGIIPAVIKYFVTFVAPDQDHSKDIEDFLLTASAVGILIKTNASIAGAEVGCQGEVGSASAMAAAGLAEVLGGTPAQVENAAEIAMEHNLGLTCDPIGGLVQVPCIERNAIGAVKAINAARMALRGDGQHTVSLDVVVETMRQTGLDMHAKYKETSTGGLAVNIVEC